MQCPTCTGSLAGWLQARINPVHTEGTLLYLLGIGIILRDTIRTGPFAVAAPDTLILVNQDNAVSTPFADGINRAGGQAGWVLTMVTSRGNESFLDIGISTAIVKNNPAPTGMGRDPLFGSYRGKEGIGIVFGLTGNGTALTASAFIQLNKPTFLGHLLTSKRQLITNNL